MKSSYHFAAGVLVICLGLICSSVTHAQQRTPVPELYFYPAAYKLADGSLTGDILTVAPEQITTQFPVVREMSGVVMKLYWSELCPTANSCNFSIIDTALAYWGARNKKVVLQVSTMGPPIKVIENGNARFVTQTPSWVLQQVDTYPARAETLGQIKGFDNENGHSIVDTVYPSYRDTRWFRRSRPWFKRWAKDMTEIQLFPM